MDISLRGRVLIIGSLFWQDDFNPKVNDGMRKKWRNENLDMESTINLKVPIRYGRYSKDKSYTMVFDNKLNNEQYGNAKAIFFNRKTFTHFSQIKVEIEKLSSIEGRFCSNFIKGSRNESIAWCVCTLLLNPNTVSPEVKEFLLEQWQSELKKNEVGYKKFISSPELYSLKKSGELDIPWPEELSDTDFLVATSTKPLSRKGIKEVISEEIAKHVKNREYFHPNVRHGIRTFQDDEIMAILRSKNAINEN